MVEAGINQQHARELAKTGSPIEMIPDAGLKHFLQTIDMSFPEDLTLFTILQMTKLPKMDRSGSTEYNLRQYGIIAHYKGRVGKNKIFHDKMQIYQIAVFKYIENTSWGMRSTYNTPKPIEAALELLGPSPITNGILPPDKSRPPRSIPLDEDLSANASNTIVQYHEELNYEDKATLKKTERSSSITYLRDISDNLIKKAYKYTMEDIEKLKDSIDPNGIDELSSRSIDLEIALAAVAVDLLMDTKTQQIDPRGLYQLTGSQTHKSLNLLLQLMEEKPQFKTFGHLLLRLKSNLKKRTNQQKDRQ